MEHGKMNTTDAFERALRNSLESYEVPYNSADWAQLERELDKSSGVVRSSTAALIALLFGGTMALASTAYLLLNTPADHGQSTIAALQQHTAQVVAPADQQATPETVVNVDPSAPPQESGTAALPAKKEKGNADDAHVEAAAGGPGPTPVEPAAPETNGQIRIWSSISEGCMGSSVEFHAENAPDHKDVLWNFGDGSFSTAKSPTHVFAKPGRFEVVLSHSSFLDKPVSGVIVIHEQPEADFNPVPQHYDNAIPYYAFANHSSTGSYLWDFGDGSTSTVNWPNHVYKESGSYTVSLTVTSASGCQDRTEHTIRIEDDYNLLAAKTFSPDGDGVEDNFVPEALKTLGLRFRMTVHDPVSGQLVFETTDAKRPWNGRIGGRGEACASGNYVWMVEMKDGDKVGGTYTGTVELMR